MSGEPGHAVSALLQNMLHARHALGHEPDNDDLTPPTGVSPFAAAEDVARWFASDSQQILAVAQDAVVSCAPDTAAQLLAQIWAIVPAATDAAWCDALRDCGRSLRDALPESRVLATVFRRSATVYLARGDHRIAEAEGMRELGIWRLLDDPDGHVSALNALAVIFQARDRLHRVIDCADERLQVDLRHGRAMEVAGDLQHLGAVMLLADQPASAIDYLTRAVDAFDELPETSAQQHADVRVLLGRAQWISGAESAARRQFSHALQYLIDIDEAAAERVRDLLRTTPGEKLR